MFSSVACAFGAPGQSNHSSSNSFEDTLAYHRKSVGLPATSINWGNWGEVGVATEIDLPGVRPISTKQGLLTLETFLRTQRSHVVVANIDSYGMLAKLFPMVKSYVSDKKLLGETKLHVAMTSDEFWTKVDTLTSREEKLDAFKAFIKTTVAFTLKLDQDEEIDDNTDFQTLGIDSLMMLEMKNGLQNTLGARMTLTAAQLKDCNNTMVLAERLLSLLEGEDTDIDMPTVEELQKLVVEDSTLPEHISLGDGLEPARNVGHIETVLLLGVTGTLGPYLLRNLSQRAQIKKIYCLVRKSGKSSPLERVQSRLKHVNLLEEVDMEKVECIQGDISDPKLGLSEENYNKLAGEVDAICHSAVRADHTAKYWKAPESKKNNVRTVNVFGVIKILEFAIHTKLKHVYYATTLLTIPAINSEGSISEEWHSEGEFDDVIKHNPGYPISKYISEQLMKQAAERGVPVKAFRLPGISGDSRTGRNDFEMNHIILRWLAYMKLGCMPDMPSPLPLVPVDQCASISLNVFFNSKVDSAGVYNISMRGAGIEQALIEVAQCFNIHVEPIPFAEFIEKVKLEKDDSPLAPFKKMYQDEGNDVVDSFVNTSGCYVQKYLENPTDFFKSSKLLQLYPKYEESLESNYVIMKRDLQYLKESGVFEKFGIK